MTMVERKAAREALGLESDPDLTDGTLIGFRKMARWPAEAGSPFMPWHVRDGTAFVSPTDRRRP